jgi:predicted transcriptional regulator
VLDQVERGHGTVAELARTMEEAQDASRTLSELELLGLVRREFGGRYVRCL